MSSGRLIASILFAGFLILWLIGFAFSVAAGARPRGLGLVCGLPLLVAVALFALVFARTGQRA